MKFSVETLIDITETGARKGTSDKLSYNQQQNFQTLVQTVGLRVNIEIDQSPVCETKSAKDFGSTFKGKHKIWCLEFEVEYEEALTVDMLIDDFDLVPVILNLDETAEQPASVFRTRDTKTKNIVFKCVD